MIRTQPSFLGLLLLGFVYGVVLLASGFLAAGYGHGTYVPLGLFSSPTGLIALIGSALGPDSPLTAAAMLLCLAAVPVQWALLYGYAGQAARVYRARVFLGYMALHYATAAILLTRDPFGDWSYFPSQAGIAMVGLGVYVMGQAVL